MSLTEINGNTYELIVVDGNNRITEFESDPSDKLETNNTYDKLINLIKEQSQLLSEQQERIDTLEKRVNHLELKN